MDEALALAGLVERLSHCACGEAYCEGLKPTQWSALRYFARANRFSCTTTAFARFQGTSTAAASQTIGALVERGLLKRKSDPKDKRRHHLSLSPRAAALIDTDPLRTLADAVGVLDADEQLVLKQQLERMLDHVNAARADAAFGHCGDCRFLQCRRHGGARNFSCAHVGEGLDASELDDLCANFSPGRVRE